MDEARRSSANPAPLRVWLPVMEALVATREGRPDDALRSLQPVARFEKGNDFVATPLLVRGLATQAAGRPADAAAAFEDVVRIRPIASGPWLVVSRLGLARALRDSGDRTRSLAAYDVLLESWKDADRTCRSWRWCSASERPSRRGEAGGGYEFP